MAMDEAAKSLRRRKIIFYTILFFLFWGLYVHGIQGILENILKKVCWSFMDG